MHRIKRNGTAPYQSSSVKWVKVKRRREKRTTDGFHTCSSCCKNGLLCQCIWSVVMVSGRLGHYLTLPEQHVESPFILEPSDHCRASQTAMDAVDLIGAVFLLPFNLTQNEVGFLASVSPFIIFFTVARWLYLAGIAQPLMMKAKSPLDSCQPCKNTHTRFLCYQR